MNPPNADAVGLYFYLLDKLYQRLLSYDLDFTGLERYFMILWAIDESENLTQQNLADLLKIDKASVVRIADDLEKKGFIQRVMNPSDKRAYFLELSKKGNKYIKDVHEGIDNLNAEMFMGFTQKEKEIFIELLHKVYLNLSQQPESDFLLKFLAERQG